MSRALSPQRVPKALSHIRPASDSQGVLIDSNDGKTTLHVKKLTLSATSDRFQTGKKYVGMMLYGHKGQDTWTLNGVRGAAGLVHIVETSKVRRNRGISLHAKLFYHLFRQEPDKHSVAAGFAYLDGTWKYNSKTYNMEGGQWIYDDFHDKSKTCGDLEISILQPALSAFESGQRFSLNIRVAPIPPAAPMMSPRSALLDPPRVAYYRSPGGRCCLL